MLLMCQWDVFGGTAQNTIDEVSADCAAAQAGTVKRAEGESYCCPRFTWTPFVYMYSNMGLLFYQ